MKKGKILIVLGLLLVAAALGLTLYNVLDSQRAGKASASVLEQLAPQVEQAAQNAPVYLPADVTHLSEPEIDPVTGRAEPVEYPDFVLNPQMEPPAQQIDGNSYIGILSIPSLEQSFPILKECTDDNLRIAPCCYSGSPYLNDFVIAGHNYTTHFGSLGAVRIGDSVQFTDLDGNVFDYEVMEVTTLPANAVEEMTSGEWDLTLFTCTVSRADRITVRCKLK